MKKIKRLTILPVFLSVAIFLSGCVQRTKSGKPYGFVYDNLAIPTQHIMLWLSSHLGDSLGWAIIVLTFVVRLVLMPLMLQQSKKATIQQEKMSSLQPQMRKIQERQKAAKSKEEQAAVSQDMMRLYRENGVSLTGGIGCLPILIQMPIFAALYAAIQYSPELSGSYFMGINLGQKSYILAALTFLIYLLQGYLSTLGIPKEQKKQMQSMMFMSPIMLGFMTVVAPAGLGLYFFIGGIFACIQVILINFMRPKIRAEIQAELKKNPPKKIIHEEEKIVHEKASQTVTHMKQEFDTAKKDTQKNRKRNAGKQRRK
ncbi:MAG: membrane protein insertase YidC [Liquorilactobacillus ghanensis]|uniref:membrane protein insertase YidC n=1 Tax=Liquorilactobacillus ghanensis TaxID=399370 RepID=UPI0039EA31B5